MIEFEEIIILGKGKLAVQCAQYLQEHYALPVFLYDTNKTPSEYVTGLCTKAGVPHSCLGKEELFSELCGREKQTLIISACNAYILPKKLLDKSNVKAINFHSALLPKHPGRNAEAWAIFEEDELAGITWHTVVPEVDAGKIISQKNCEVGNMTSLKLLTKQNAMGYEAFTEFIDDFLNDRAVLLDQPSDTKYPMHYSYDRPNNGELDTEWSISKISAFLRCYDYGLYYNLGKPHILVGGKKYVWKKYKISACDSIADDRSIEVADNITIREGGVLIELLGAAEEP